jgi:hypothetical protein
MPPVYQYWTDKRLRSWSGELRVQSQRGTKKQRKRLIMWARPGFGGRSRQQVSTLFLHLSSVPYGCFNLNDKMVYIHNLTMEVYGRRNACIIHVRPEVYILLQTCNDRNADLNASKRQNECTSAEARRHYFGLDPAIEIFSFDQSKIQYY